MRSLLILAVAMGAASQAEAARIYVSQTQAQPGISAEIAQQTHRFVQESVIGRSGDTLVSNTWDADATLQPRLMRLGDSYVLTIEHLKNNEIVHAQQLRVNSPEELQGAARSATLAALDQGGDTMTAPGTMSAASSPQSAASDSELQDPSVDSSLDPSLDPSMSSQSNQARSMDSSQSQPPRGVLGQAETFTQNQQEKQKQIAEGGMTSTTQGSTDAGPASSEVLSAAGTDATTLGRNKFQLSPGTKPFSYWSVGAGPALARRLETDDLFYNLSVSHTWDLHPRISVKALGEASLSTGGDTAFMYNVAGGANWFFIPTASGSAYLGADIGFGWARAVTDDDAAGITFAGNIGYQFLRTESTSLDVALRYAVLTSEATADGFPQIIGARLAVNF